MGDLSNADEVFNNASDNESGGNLTYVKPKNGSNSNVAGEAAKTSKASGKSKSSHPPYSDMVQEAIMKLAARSGVSKLKINEYIKSTYELDEVNNIFVKKALKTGLEKGTLINATGTGASGSFKLSKEHKEVLKKAETTKAKKEKTIATKKDEVSETKVDDKDKENRKTTNAKKSKDELEPSKEKKVAKKPPVAKGKDNKPPKSTGSQKVLKEKVKTLQKANSTGNMQRKIAKALPAEQEGEKETIKNPPAKKKTKKASKK